MPFLLRRNRLRLIWPTIKLAWRYLDSEDVWTVADAPVPNEMFGTGCQHDFPWYFEGKTAVPIGSVTDITTWLAGCVSASDADIFQLPDFWQHPRTFEQIRRGDCEDHALWAWRKLIELGLPSELMVGSWLKGRTEGEGGHTWIAFHDGSQRFLLEPVEKDPSQAVKRFAEARQDYVPHLSIDGRFRRRMYGGLLHWFLEARAKKRAKAAA